MGNDTHSKPRITFQPLDHKRRLDDQRNFSLFLIISALFLVLVFDLLAHALPSARPLFQLLYPKSRSSAAGDLLGDVNGDGRVNVFDLGIMMGNYGKKTADEPNNLNLQRSDLKADGQIDIFDLGILASNYGKSGPTPSVTTTITPTTNPTVTTSPTPMGPTPTTVIGKGIWISPDELVQRPMSGSTWTAMQQIADSDVGQANMSDQDSSHSERTYALALVAARTKTAAYLEKAATEIVEIIGTENNPDPDCSGPQYGARGLAVGRNLIAYVLAADVINLRKGGFDPAGKGTRFDAWVDQIRHRKNCDNNGGTVGGSLMEAGYSGSNGSSLSLASRLAAAVYLGDNTDITTSWNIYRRFLGDTTSNVVMDFNSYSQTWRHEQDPAKSFAINPKGATTWQTHYPADGVIVNDQGRGGSAPSNTSTAPPYTQYPWEGLQGIYASALMFDRLGMKDGAGKTSWHTADDAALRAVQYQCYLQDKFGGSWYDATRAAWVKHLAYYTYGYKCTAQGQSITAAPVGGGRNLDYTQWTHPR